MTHLRKRLPVAVALALLALLGARSIAQDVQIEPQPPLKRTPAFAHSLPNPPNLSNPDLEGFNVTTVRFDESVNRGKPVPIIPKSWRLVAVNTGEYKNSSNLWFQDAEGNIYLVSGYVAHEEFTLREQIHKITVK